MARGASRECVSCAAGWNWCSFILLLFASISSYWTWGYAYPPASSGSVVPVTVSTGPWLAAQSWASVPVPCMCSNGICMRWCLVGTEPVYWSNIPAEAACGPNSIVYREWSGPLGYCTFPVVNGSTAPPTLPPVSLPAGATGENIYGGVPAGTTFNVPSQIIGVQALIVIATVTVFIAAMLGCADAASDNGGKTFAGGAALCSLIAWVFCLSAYCVWTAIPYIQQIQSVNPTVYMPVWVNRSNNELSAIQVFDTWLGPGFATALTASIMIFFSTVIHCMSLADSKSMDDDAPNQYNVPPKSVPTGHQHEAFPTPVVQAVPAAVTLPVPAAAMPPASVNNNIATV